jgi:hypothetical protein
MGQYGYKLVKFTIVDIVCDGFGKKQREIPNFVSEIQV